MREWKQWADYTAICVRGERHRQLRKFGFQEHTPEEWLAILTEEVGELAKAIVEKRFGPPLMDANATIAKEAIQVAAVASAMVQQLKWERPV